MVCSSVLILNNIYSMKKAILFSFLITTLIAGAQEFPYTLSVSTESYSDLENATIISTETWDDPDYMIPLGFEFEFMGSTGSSLYISPLLYGGALAFTDQQVTVQDLIIVYGSDLIDIGYNEELNLSPISVLTEGEPGQRIAKIEWKTCGFYNEVADQMTSGNRVSFQFWIYEESGDLEIRFGNSSIKQPDLVHDGGFPYIAFADDLNIFTNTPVGSWFLEGPVLSPTLNLYTNLNTLGAVPALNGDPYYGITYRFIKQGSVGITDMASNESQWVAYPNPFSSDISFRYPLGLTENWTLELKDMSGSTVLKETLRSNNQHAGLSGLSAGIYFATFSNGKEIQTMKICKQD